MKLSRLRHSRAGFTLIELLVGMVVFVTGITAVFLLLEHTMRSAVISRNETMVSNILREQLELVRYIRDTNLVNYAAWDITPTQEKWQSGAYIIENQFGNNVTQYGQDGEIMSSPVSLQTVSVADTIEARFDQTRLYFDENMRYTHNVTASGTQFASYITVTPLEFAGENGDIITVTRTGTTSNNTEVQMPQ